MVGFENFVGLMGVREFVVGVEDSARSLGSGDVNVLSTPSMIRMMEETSRLLVQDKLPEGYTTVGVRVDVRHLKAASVGCKIKVVSELLKVEGRRLVFRVEAYWRNEKIGEGVHERFIVSRRDFWRRLKGGWVGYSWFSELPFLKGRGFLVCWS